MTVVKLLKVNSLRICITLFLVFILINRGVVVYIWLMTTPKIKILHIIFILYWHSHRRDFNLQQAMETLLLIGFQNQWTWHSLIFDHSYRLPQQNTCLVPMGVGCLRPRRQNDLVNRIGTTENCVEVKGVPMHYASAGYFSIKVMPYVLQFVKSYRHEVYFGHPGFT